MFEDMYSGELSEEQVLFRQILIIGGLSTRLFSDTTTDWQVNVRNYIESINNFEAIAIRNLDRDYIRKKKILIDRSKKKLEEYRSQNPTHALTNLGKDYEMRLTINYGRKLFALIIKTLDNKGVFNEMSYRAIENPTPEELRVAKGELPS